MGMLVGQERMPIDGLDPFITASMVAFGVVYAKQPVQFFGVLPLTGRQLMYGFIGFLVLYGPDCSSCGRSARRSRRR